MAIDFICGWECGDLGGGSASSPDQAHWDGVAGAPLIDDSLSDQYLWINATGTAINVRKTIARTVVAGRVYVKFTSFAVTTFIRHINANGNLDIDVDASGNVTAICGSQAGTRSATVATLSTGTWYRIDWLADSSSGTASLKVQVDGGTERTATFSQASASMTSMHYGNKATVTIEMRFNHLITGDASGDYPFGFGTVEYLFPESDGTHLFTAGSFAHDTAGTNVVVSDTDVWQYVGVRPLTSTTQFIRQKAADAAGYLEVVMGNLITYNYAALGINVLASFHSAGTGTNAIGLVLNDGGSLHQCLDAAGDNLMNVSQTTVMIVEDVVLSPPSGGTWTRSRIDALRLRGGYATDVVDIPYWDDALIEVAYGSAPATTYSPKLLNENATAIARSSRW